MITYSKLSNFGRFGNQLWQIASTIGIANRNNTGYVFPQWDYARFFKNQLPYGKLDGPIKIFSEKTTRYNEVIIDNKHNWDLSGYFQSWKYFENEQDTIKYYFDLNLDLTINATSIHVRRGDYLAHQDIHPVYGLDYYRKALEYFDKKEDLFVFSDDINWCKRYFKDGIFSGRNIIFDIASDTIFSFKQMMSCQNNIITNSSFSWWAAYLNKNKNKIIVSPKIWTHLQDDVIEDRLLENWIRI